MKLFIQRFLATLRSEKNYSSHTLRAYEKDLAEFEKFRSQSGQAGVDTLSRQSVRSFLVYLQSRGLKRSSVLRKLSSLRAFSGYLQEQGLLKRDPFLNVRLPKRERTLPKFLTQAEVQGLLERETGKPSWTAHRDRAILELFYSSGLRRLELCRLNVSDVDFVGGVVRVLGKGSRERVVPVGGPALKALKRYLDSRPPERGLGGVCPLWLNGRGRRLSDSGIFFIVRRWARAAGFLKPISPHALRHSFATQLLDGGCDLRSLQEMLGHKTLQATQIYTHTTLERIRKVYEKSHPRAGVQ